MDELKHCSGCHEHKPPLDFHKNRRMKSGLSNVCKDCNMKYHRRMYYNLTDEAYDDLYKKQNGCCAICHRKEDQFKSRLSVDHDHETGEIRGLLCGFCNHRIVGRFKRGGPLKNAAAYLEGEYTGIFVPNKYLKGKHGRKKKKI